MTIGATTAAVHRAELGALDAVVTLVDADRHRDPVAYRSVLSEDFTERVDGALVALGADAGLALARERWHKVASEIVEIEDISVTLPHVFVRSVMRERDAVGTTVIVGVGYSVFEVDADSVRTASHFVRRFGTPVVTESRPSTSVPPPPADALPRQPRRSWRVAAVGLATILVQDLFLAAPVVAATSRWGGGRAFLVFAPLYGALALATAFLTLRLLRRKVVGTNSRIASFLDREVSGGLARRTLQAGGALGFVVGAYLFSAAPTVWALHGLGIRDRLRAAAIAASLIWGVGFVAFYAGAATLIGL